MNEYACAAQRLKRSCATAMASMAWCKGSIAVVRLKENLISQDKGQDKEKEKNKFVMLGARE